MIPDRVAKASECSRIERSVFVSPGAVCPNALNKVASEAKMNIR